jgi:hypothetical protein
MEYHNHEREHQHGLSWIQNKPIYKIVINKLLNNKLIYIFCDMSFYPMNIRNYINIHATHTWFVNIYILNLI